MTFGDNLRNLWRVLKGTPFGRYSLGNVSTMAGSWMVRLATAWLGWELTQSPSWLGALAFADMFPAIICAPLAGVAADRWNRITLLRWLLVSGALVSTLTMVAFYAGMLGIWPLFGLTLLQGIIASLAQPLRFTIVSELVPRADLPVGVAINAISFNVARFIGPALAGVMIATTGVGLTFLVNVAMHIAFLLQLRGIAVSGSIETRAGSSILGDMRDGFTYLLSQRMLAPLILQATGVAVCIRPIAELLPAISDDIYAAGTFGLALMTSVVGIGAMVGGIWFAGLPNMNRLIAMIGINGVISTGAVITAVSTGYLVVGAVSFAVIGFTVVSSGIATQAAIQMTVPNELRGRMMSTYGMIVRAAPALGALGIGFLSEVTGLFVAVALVCPVCLMLSIYLLLRRRALQQRFSLEGRPDQPTF